jgi:uncharacterized protein (TIGR02145 family)
MAWNDLLSNQMVSYTDAQGGGFTLNAGQSNVGSTQCMTSSQAQAKYNLNAVSMSAYASNQLVPKNVWVNGVNDTICVINPGWVTTNATHTAYSDGTLIPEVQLGATWDALTTGAWCYYNNDPLLGAVYGKLYNWYAVVGIYDAASLSNPALRKSFAPNGSGLMVPSLSDYNTLATCLGGGSVAGGKMKEVGTTHWTSPNTSATNSSGFTSLPGGYRERFSTSFIGINTTCYFWTKTETDATTSSYFGQAYNTAASGTSGVTHKALGMSVRLLLDPTA